MSNDPSGVFQVVRFVPLVFVVIGVGLILSSLRRYRAYRRFLARAVHVGGEVTGHDAVRIRSDSGTTTYWHPVLRFTTADGRLVDTRSMAGRRLKRPAVGERVEVLYDPLDPLRAGLPGASGAMSTLTPLFLGLVFIPVGLLVFGVFSVAGAFS